jgi:hypothetical protein
VATSVHSPGDAPTQEHCQGSDGAEARGSLVLDVAEWLCVFTVVRVRFVRGTARYRTWREVKRRPHDGASRSLQREFELVIVVEVLIEVGSEEARARAGLRPPLKLHGRFSRMQLSRRLTASEMQ